MELTSLIFSFETLIVAIASSVILLTITKVSANCPVDFMKKTLVQRFMPIYPLILGAVFSLVIHPESMDTIPKQLIWSLIPSFTSTWGFKLYKTLFMEKFNVEIEEKEKK